MAVANGIWSFRGKSGMTYSVSAYYDDVANDPVRFSSAGKAIATSPTEWSPPEPVVLTDICMASNTATPLYHQILRGSAPTGDILLNAVHLASVVVRPGLRVVFGPSQRVACIQLS